MNKVILALIALSSLATACSTQRLAWERKDNESAEQFEMSYAGCQKEALRIEHDKFGARRDNYVIKCMYSKGNRLVDLNNPGEKVTTIY